MRFNRDYELVVGEGTQAVIIKPPLNIVFDVYKSVAGGLNKANITISNLKESNRLRIVKDTEEQKRIIVILKVGYQDSLQTIFQGTVETGKNRREGVNFLSELECLDGGFDFKYSFTSKTVKGKDLAVNELLKDLPNTQKGKVTDLEILAHPKVLLGNTYKILEDMIQGETEDLYIDNEQINIIKKDEVTSGNTPLVSATSGLINTPTRENKEVTFDTMMNPTIKIGQRVALESITAPHLNGVYKVDTINYKGEFDGGSWTQTVTGRALSNFKVV